MIELEIFLLDPANRAAATAAQAVADGTGLPRAPLVVLGPPGSGKSELLDAMRDRLLARHPAARVERLDADALAERYRTALVLGTGDACRAELAAADLVLIDDLERLARHRDCQGLLTDLLEARGAAGRETVLTTPRAPREIDGLDARLVRRIGEGAVVRVALPGPAARRELLRRKSPAERGAVPAEVIDALAEAEFPSLRDYTGALSRLAAFQEASASPLSPADALVLIGAPGAGSAAVPTGPDPSTAEPGRGGLMDEFGAFLSEVQASVSEQVDRWRRRIEEAVRRWSAEGLRTRRLEALLAEDAPVDPDPVLEDYEARVRELRGIAEQIRELAPDLAGAEVFRDPDQIATARELLDRARAGGGLLAAPLPRYRLEDYAEGAANRIALEAVRQVVAGASPSAPVLLIVGSAGSGKTHLLHGAGNALVAKGAGPVACLSAHAFAAEVAGLAGAEQLESWRQRYRWVAALLLDDLQLLARQSPAQEELVRLVGELREGGRPLVCTATAPPESLPGLEARLVERLREAAVVPLRPPDREIRLAVAKQCLAGTAAAQDAGLADYFAGRPAESVRSLMAAVDRLLAAAAAQHVTPSATLAREVLDLPEPAVPVPASRSGSVRGSGILSPGVGLVKSREKMIDAWPRVADYLITEFR